jgi:hypothetical protein
MMKWAAHIARMAEMENAYFILAENTQRKRATHKARLQHIIKIDIRV